MSRKLRFGISTAVIAGVAALILIPKKTASFETRMTVASTFFAATAAVAAVLALWYASKTIAKAELAAREADGRHLEQMDRMDAQIDAMKDATRASAQQHELEMDDRRWRASVASIDQKLIEIDHAAELVREMADVARREHREPPGEVAAGHSASRLPVLSLRLENSLLLLFGHRPEPDRAELHDTALMQLVTKGRGRGAEPVAVLGQAVDALYELKKMTEDLLAQRTDLFAT